MTFTPDGPQGSKAYKALVKPDRPFPGYVYPHDINVPALRDVLIAVTCPIPCVGYVNETGWHKGCEARADAALATLGL